MMHWRLQGNMDGDASATRSARRTGSSGRIQGTLLILGALVVVGCGDGQNDVDINGEEIGLDELWTRVPLKQCNSSYKANALYLDNSPSSVFWASEPNLNPYDHPYAKRQELFYRRNGDVWWTKVVYPDWNTDCENPYNDDSVTLCTAIYQTPLLVSPGDSIEFQQRITCYDNSHQWGSVHCFGDNTTNLGISCLYNAPAPIPDPEPDNCYGALYCGPGMCCAEGSCEHCLAWL
jgi:hypothetical protein